MGVCVRVFLVILSMFSVGGISGIDSKMSILETKHEIDKTSELSPLVHIVILASSKDKQSIKKETGTNICNKIVLSNWIYFRDMISGPICAIRGLK